MMRGSGDVGPGIGSAGEPRCDQSVGRGQALGSRAPRRESRAQRLLERIGACVLGEQGRGFRETPCL